MHPSLRTPLRAAFLVSAAALLSAGPSAQHSIGDGGYSKSSKKITPTVFGSSGNGGKYKPPSDASGPPITDPPTPPDPGAPGPNPQPKQPLGSDSRRPGSGLGVTAGPATGGSRTGGEAGAGSVTGGFDAAESWMTWWETNKFDFIELRRMRDPSWTGQGVEQETPAERELRLARVRATVRESVLPALRGLAGSPDEGVRAAAIVALAKLGDTESIDTASGLLLDPSLEVRKAAMLALGVLDSGRGSYILMNIAGDTRHGRTLLDDASISIDDRGTALLSAALRRSGSSSVVLSQLIAEREDTHPVLLSLAADAAGLLGSSTEVQALVEIAYDRTLPEYVRSAATSALGRIADPAAVPALMGLLDMELEPRRAAAIALGGVAVAGSTRLVDRLVVALERDKDAATRHFAAISLGRIGGDQARDALLAARTNCAAELRPWILLALGLTERAAASGKVVPVLIEHLATEANNETIAAGLIALGLSRSEQALPTLVEQLASGPSSVAAYAAMGLGLTGLPAAAAPLRQALQSSTHALVVQQAALALGILGDVPSVGALVELVRRTGNPFIASYAALGIGLIGDENAAGPLLDLVQSEGPRGIATMYATSALGALFDEDRRPVLSRLASSDNYLARSTAVDDLLSLGF